MVFYNKINDPNTLHKNTRVFPWLQVLTMCPCDDEAEHLFDDEEPQQLNSYKLLIKQIQTTFI